ncbi:hypothetical protein [Streptomyces sp. CRN 30]|uniref:hypothetical protein n=1 Tax=Streptomyces sp. CRN 30 TaxID=3075613 RepID=UPI002A7FC549|nr:hypothetical protein [Streptomyces sp. CRN 30]
MLTSDFSRTDWWIAAFVAGTAAAVAFRSLIPERRNKWAAALLPLAAGLGVVADSVVRGDEGHVPLQLYTAAMLGLALTRVAFTGYIRRQTDRVRSGQPVRPLTAGQFTVFLVTLVAVILAIAVTL